MRCYPGNKSRPSGINAGNEVTERMAAGILRHAGPDGAMSGDLHAIGLEVESNEIRLLRLMPRLKVNSGTAGGGRLVGRHDKHKFEMPADDAQQLVPKRLKALRADIYPGQSQPSIS
jgi:hypothetical protein